jgi:Flp pilus assembly protein TadG
MVFGAGWRLSRPAIAGSRQRGRGDGGAVLVEAAFVLPVFAFLVFGIIEGSLLLRDHLTIAAITGDAGRSAAIAGNESDADYRILQQIGKTSSTISSARIESIVVFKATQVDDTVPAGCKAGTATSAGPRPCNVYDGLDLDDAAPANFTCTTPQKWRFYCPADRQVGVNPAPGPDLIGIYVRIRHDPITNFFGGTRIIERTVVFRLEPQVLND